MCGLLPSLKMPLGYPTLALKRKQERKKEKNLKSGRKNSLELESSYSMNVLGFIEL